MTWDGKLRVDLNRRLGLVFIQFFPEKEKKEKKKRGRVFRLHMAMARARRWEGKSQDD